MIENLRNTNVVTLLNTAWQVVEFNRSTEISADCCALRSIIRYSADKLTPPQATYKPPISPTTMTNPCNTALHLQATSPFTPHITHPFIPHESTEEPALPLQAPLPQHQSTQLRSSASTTTSPLTSQLSSQSPHARNNLTPNNQTPTQPTTSTPLSPTPTPTPNPPKTAPQNALLRLNRFRPQVPRSSSNLLQGTPRGESLHPGGHKKDMTHSHLLPHPSRVMRACHLCHDHLPSINQHRNSPMKPSSTSPK